MTPPDRVFLQMWEPAREMFIADHEFYVAQAKLRLLAQFSERWMEAEAQSHAEEWLERQSGENDPDSAYERAIEIKSDFYQSLVDLREATRLSVVAGMFHKWEKQLRDWLDCELGHLGLGERLSKAVRKASLDDLLDLFAACGWSVRDRPYWHDLDLCRLVTNVYKHGQGPSFDRLCERAPHMCANDDKGQGYVVSFLDFATVTVTDEDLARFASAIADFWRDFPENIYVS